MIFNHKVHVTMICIWIDHSYLVDAGQTGSVVHAVTASAVHCSILLVSPHHLHALVTLRSQHPQLQHQHHHAPDYFPWQLALPSFTVFLLSLGAFWHHLKQESLLLEEAANYHLCSFLVCQQNDDGWTIVRNQENNLNHHLQLLQTKLNFLSGNRDH